MIPLTQYWPDATDELQRELNKFQRQVRDALDRVELEFSQRYRPTDVKLDTYRANLWDMVRVDTTTAHVQLIPNASRATQGGKIAFVRASGSATITIEPLDGTINGSASYSWTSGPYLELASDGAGDWRVV